MSWKDSFPTILRPQEGRVLGGVCLAMAERYSIDVTLLRFAMLLLSLAWGSGVLLYGVLWLLLPQDREDRHLAFKDRFSRKLSGVELDFRRSAETLGRQWSDLESKSWPRPLGRRWLALSLIVVGLLLFLTSMGVFSWLTPMRALGLAVFIAGASILASMRPRGGRR